MSKNIDKLFEEIKSGMEIAEENFVIGKQFLSINQSHLPILIPDGSRIPPFSIQICRDIILYKITPKHLNDLYFTPDDSRYKLYYKQAKDNLRNLQ